MADDVDTTNQQGTSGPAPAADVLDTIIQQGMSDTAPAAQDQNAGFDQHMADMQAAHASLLGYTDNNGFHPINDSGEETDAAGTPLIKPAYGSLAAMFNPNDYGSLARQNLEFAGIDAGNDPTPYRFDQGRASKGQDPWVFQGAVPNRFGRSESGRVDQRFASITPGANGTDPVVKPLQMPRTTPTGGVITPRPLAQPDGSFLQNPFPQAPVGIALQPRKNKETFPTYPSY